MNLPVTSFLVNTGKTHNCFVCVNPSLAFTVRSHSLTARNAAKPEQAPPHSSGRWRSNTCKQASVLLHAVKNKALLPLESFHQPHNCHCEMVLMVQWSEVWKQSGQCESQATSNYVGGQQRHVFPWLTKERAFFLKSCSLKKKSSSIPYSMWHKWSIYWVYQCNRLQYIIKLEMLQIIPI